MPKNLSPNVLAQVQAGQLRPALFLEIAFQTETVWLWSGLGPITAPGPAYSSAATFPYGAEFLGMGWLGQVQAVPQVSDIVATNVTLTLSGIPVELVTDAINAVRENSQATLWLGMLDQNSNVIGDPVQLFQGSLDVPTLTEGADTCTISITAESPLIDLNRAPNRRFTDVDQQIDYPGDTGFAAVQLLQDFRIVWPMPYGSNTSPAPPNYLVITSASPVTIRLPGTFQLACTEYRSDGGTSDVTNGGGPWFSSDDSVATVTDAGLVTAVAPGMCNMTKRFVQGEFRGSSSSDQPSALVQASVTVIVTQ
jgi:hypothetical protein